MKCKQLIQILQDHLDEPKRFGVQSLAIFGSVARHEAGCGSDIDLLVEFENKPTFDQYMDLKFFWRICWVVLWIW